MVTFLIAQTVLLTQAVFNYTKCPSSYELWQNNPTGDVSKVPRTFNVSKFAPQDGAMYYELAFHDWTQKPSCPSPKCVTSFKQYDTQRNQINDTFTLDCEGLAFHPALRFEFTNITGSLLGWWEGKIGPQHGWIPDTVVDFKISEDGSRYEWVLELQCVEELGHVDFVGINFYSSFKDPGMQYINTFVDHARAFGLGVYLDHGEGVTIVNQTDCAK
eukprot:m.19838 g.19838  ORF g.19838 m.19838 type:complete len:216 (+) comp6686_c0_seq2:85-732(+)